MKKEIRQNGKSILWSDDGVTIDIIFSNLTEQNFKGKEYSNYIQYVALPDMGFEYGKIEYVEDGKIIKKGTIKKTKL